MNSLLSNSIYLGFVIIATSLIFVSRRKQNLHSFLESCVILLGVQLSCVYLTHPFFGIGISNFKYLLILVATTLIAFRRKRIFLNLSSFLENFKRYKPNAWLLLGTLYACVSFAPSLLGGPSTDDERAYHWPQALAMIQANHFTFFDAKLPWTYSYPLGNSALMVFSWVITGNDLAFRAPQLQLLLISQLSLFLLVRKIYNTKLSSIICALTFFSPLTAVFLRMSTADLAYGSLIISACYFLFEALNQNDTKQAKRHAVWFFVCFALAGHMKFPLVALVLFTQIILIALMFKKITPITLFRAMAAPSLIGLAGIVYLIRNLLLFDNPVYPLAFKLGSFAFPNALVEISNATIRPSTTMRIEAPFRYLKSMQATFFDWFQIPNPDSLGSYNYLIGSGFLLLSLFGLLQLFRAKHLMFAFCMSAILTFAIAPGSFLPRYGFFLVYLFLTPCLMPIASLLENSTTRRVIGFLILMSTYTSILYTLNSYDWVKTNLDPIKRNILLNGVGYLDRNASLGSTLNVAPPDLVRYIQDNVEEREVVCFQAAGDHPSAFWNQRRSNVVKYAPVTELERYPSSILEQTYTSSELNAYLSKHMNCDYLVLYEKAVIEFPTPPQYLQTYVSKDEPRIIVWKRN